MQEFLQAPYADVKPEIFISYTNRGELGAKLSERLVTVLENAGFSPLRDKERLVHGDAWHDGLDAMLCQCHGAVVVLSREAAESDWVRREATILSHRKRLARDFVLLPVLVGEATEGDFDGLGFADLKAFQHAGVDDVAAFVAEDPALLKLRNHFAIYQPEAVMQAHIEARLRCAQPAGLIAMARKLEVEVTEWANDRDLAGLFARNLAAGLSELPIERVARALEFVLGDLGETRCREILKLLASNWIPVEAARLLRTAVEEPGQCFAVNDAKDWTRNMYLRRARCFWNPWKSLRVLGVDGGEDGVDSLVAELRSEWNSTVNEGSWENREAVIRDSLREPVFAAISTPPTDRDVRDLLYSKCRGLTLLLADPKLSPDIVAQSYPTAKFLSPPLAEGEADLYREKNRVAAAELEALQARLKDTEL